MSLESDIFRRRIPLPAALKEYGFTETPDGWVYEKDLLAGAFRARITVRGALLADGSCVAGDVIDADTQEPYIPLRVERQVGTFAAEVRKAYLELLEDIAEKCFREQRFLAAQTERVAAAIKKAYGDDPQHIFEKHPEITTFRNERTQKWYAITMDVSAGKLKTAAAVKKSDGKTDSDPLDRYDAKAEIEIMNVKAAPEKVQELVKRPGIYTAYHMNKKHWITILLDGTVPDADILSLIDDSHALISRGGAKKSGAQLADGVWVIPSAYDEFDVAAAFAADPDLEWQQAARMQVGDTVYIYVGVPIKAILYRCSVKAVNVPNHSGYREDKYPYVVILHLEEVYADDVMPLAKMRELGLYGVRGARRVPAGQASYLHSL